MGNSNQKNNRTHTHPRGERLSGAALRDHLATSHGWSSAMLRKRGQIEGGRYAEAWHDNAHKTQHLDNPKGT
jgi:hypothetical protein